MEIRDYVALLTKNYLVIVATAVIGVLTAGALCIVATPQYTANAKIVFTGHGGDKGRDLAYAASFAQSRIQTYKSVGDTPIVLKPVIAKLKLKDTSNELSKRVAIEASQIVTTMKISVSDDSAQQAAAIADAVAGSLINEVERIENIDQTAVIEGEVIAPASVPKSQSSPKVTIYLAVGAILGILVSIAVLALREAIVRPAQRDAVSESSGT